jgi:hypothetical protein
VDGLVDEKVAVYISKSLYNEVEKRSKEHIKKFRSVEEYVEFVLREVLKGKRKEEKYSKKDEEIIKKRLRRLGYL